MLGSDGCSRTSAQRAIFDNKLKSNDIYVNCDDISSCTPLLPDGSNNIQYPEWVLNKKVLSAGTTLSLQEVYQLLNNPPTHSDIQLSKMRSIQEYNSCIRYL
jgi:hypothetical protein